MTSGPTPADGAAPARRRPRLTLRTRLTAGLLLILLAACGVLGLATTLALRGFLIGRLDQQLDTAGVRFAGSLENPSHDPDAAQDEREEGLGPIPGQAAGTLGVRITHGKVDQTVVTKADDQSTARLTASDSALLESLPTNGRPRTVDLESIGHYRVRATRSDDGDILVVGLPTDSINDTLGRLVLIELVVFAFVMGVAGTTAAVFIRVSLRPLRDVVTTALDVSNLPLASGEVALPDRVADSDPRTEVGQVGEAFNHMLDHVSNALATREATEDRLRHFIADASHELRTPLASIMSNAEFVRRTGDGLPADVGRSLVRVESEAERMSRLVDELLLLARLDSGSPLLHEDVDLTRIVLDVVSDQSLASPAHRWVMDLPDEPVTLVGDSHRIQQVVANLLVNARTHTPAGTTVTTQLAFEPTAGGPSDIVLTVRDDGPGIPPEVLPGVFERFVRGDTSRSRAAGSSGLGLSIVAAVVRAHGGTVSVESVPGRTAFVVTLPAEPTVA